MESLIAQTSAVIAMNIRSLPQRLWMSLAALMAVAIVVAVLLAFLAMANGFKATVEGSGSHALAVILRDGSQAELNSVITRDQVNLMEQAPGISRNNQGPIASAELYVVVDGLKRTTQTKVNLPLRGLQMAGIEMRKNIKLVEGRLFQPGTNEIIVGASALREFQGFELGNKVKLGTATWTVVGVFEAQGSVFESELWADVKTLQSQFNRGSSYQVMRVQLETPGDVSALEAYVKADPRLNLEVKTEFQYFSEQASAVGDVIFYLGWPLSIAMALGALAGALNTMYTSVTQRETEIATLRAIGFSSTSAFIGTLIESLVIALVGGVVGTCAAYVFFDGVTASTLGSSFTQIVFDFQISADVFIDGIKLALIIGLIGGFFPALRASRLPVIRAFNVAS